MFYQVVVGLLAVYLCRLLLGALELGVSNRLLNRFTPVAPHGYLEYLQAAAPGYF